MYALGILIMSYPIFLVALRASVPDPAVPPYVSTESADPE
jgi:hypothetical protein